ncbi:DNA glycosylase [Hyaloraphidium curvatum]|nr:DNA glycosylase [Hyaloraphidium curvatum]
MVEGHGVARVAAAHRKLLLGKQFQARSPNGRFTDGAALINGRKLDRIESIGKNLFYFFTTASALPTPLSSPTFASSSAQNASNDESNDAVVVHVHFGMSGKARRVAYTPVSPPEVEVAPVPETKPTTRLELLNPRLGICVHFSCQTLDHGGIAFFDAWSEKLGPDPLREDADKERLWSKMQASKNKPIGLVLMDQSFVAGIGNIYRAEILYKSRVHPETPASTVTRAAFETIWHHSVDLLQRGFRTGSILTVDPGDARAPWTRRYIYNHARCRCGAQVRSWKMGGRTAYACPDCQPLDRRLVSPEKAKAVDGAKGAKVFVSHCAKEGTETLTPEKMTVAMLKEELGRRKLSVAGRKDQLLARLLESKAAEQAEVVAEGTADDTAAIEAKDEKPSAVKVEGKAEAKLPAIRPGTKHLVMEGDGEEIYSEDDEPADAPPTPTPKGKEPAFASAAAAALEKIRAGEKRNVEHVALVDEIEEAGLHETPKKPKRAARSRK